MWLLPKYFCTSWAECAATVSRLIYYASCWLLVGRVRTMASVVILSNNNASLRFNLVQRIHGAHYLLNLVLVFESYSYREMRHNSFYKTKSLHTLIYTGCNRRNGPDFGRVFLMLYYTDITQNTYVQSRSVTEIIAREKCGLHRSRRTIRRPWRHTCPMRLPNNETL